MDQTSVSLKSSKNNHQSVRANPEVVETQIATEVAASRLLGPLSSCDSQKCPLGLVPKPHQAGKWHLIVDLSAPLGHSVNDGISTEWCTPHYSSVADAVEMINSLGRGAIMAKVDLKTCISDGPCSSG